MRIRQMTSVDADAVADLIARSYDEVLVRYHPAAVLAVFREDATAEQLREQLAWKAIFVAEQDGRIVATGALADFGDPGGPQHFVSNLFVAVDLLGREDRLTAEDVTLTGGYLKGTRARTWISSADFPFAHLRGDSMSTSDDGPTLLTYDDRSRIIIYGDLTRQELIDVANSFKAYGDVDEPLPTGYGD